MTTIATVDKDRILLNWAAQNPLLTDALLFLYLGDYAGSCAIVPIQGDVVKKWYVDGSSVRVYDFAMQLTQPVSSTTDDVNIANMYIQRQWADWITEQQEAGNYPDFGPKCSGYSLELLSNMPTLAQLYENGLGKYQFYARLKYEEER
ncbi:hypothetical protein LJC33_05060 [Eubacteriales bacterium OttesenSCG-928-N13]|nr:hypothetical protein [Eubacteriales bacterium OttesenSCG-928-N13]